MCSCLRNETNSIVKFVTFFSLASPEKANRLKEAKEEATREIEEYRKEREAKFQAQQRKYAGSKDDFALKMQEDTQMKLRQIATDIDRNKEAVIKQLMALTYDIKPELHRNVRLNKK